MGSMANICQRFTNDPINLARLALSFIVIVLTLSQIVWFAVKVIIKLVA